MSENPYQSPPIDKAALVAPLWRRLVAVALRICSVMAGLLAIAMYLGGANWLRIELSRGIPLSLSVALLSGGTLAAVVCAILGLLARRLGARLSELNRIAIIVLTAVFSLGSLIALIWLGPSR